MGISRTKVGYLAHVFPRNPRPMQAWIARVAVLFEDLIIEVEGLYSEDFSKRFGIREPARKMYFLRRLTSTFLEFAEALRLLDKEPSFEKIKAGFSPANKSRWSNAIRYFRHAEPFFRAVRNDVGGHFGSEAAIFAVDHLSSPEHVGLIEAFRNDAGKTLIRLHFTSHIGALATLKSVPGKTDKERVERLVRKISAATRHATEAATVLARDYLWKRFRA